MPYDIELMGATYSDVPAVNLPRSGGGTAQFIAPDLGITGASAGDLIKISSVDANGAPTAWAKAVKGTDYEAAVASTSVSSTGLCSFKDSGGTTLFTLQLPLYNGGVS